MFLSVSLSLVHLDYPQARLAIHVASWQPPLLKWSIYNSLPGDRLVAVSVVIPQPLAGYMGSRHLQVVLCGSNGGRETF